MHRPTPDAARSLIFDPFAGISGDMIVGALIDIGLSVDWLRDLVRGLGVSADVDVDRVDRSGIACARLRFQVRDDRRQRHLSDVLEIVDAAPVPADVRDTATTIFRRIAEAEAAIHGVPVERVHFHEVGGLDSILDVLCGVAGVRELGFETCFTRPVAVGTGTVRISHGEFPLPAPATARLLEGLPLRHTTHPEECTTPTGAAVLSALTRGAIPPPEVVYHRSGYGAGTRDPAGRPNCLRLIACSVSPAVEAVYVVQADLDDMAPEYAAVARDELLDAGALDATLVRIDMKKGRPGVRLETLVPAGALGAVIDGFFAGTRTIGVRYWGVDRAVLEREEEVVEWQGQRIRWKRVRLPDGSLRSKPELDDVVAAARALGRSAQEVRTELEDGNGPSQSDRRRRQST